MTPDEFAREKWQSSAAAAGLPPLEELRARSDKFRKRVFRRNAIEYLAGLLVLAGFGWMMLFGPLQPMRIGSAMVFGGTLVVLWQLHRRTTPLTPPQHGGQLSVLEYQRRELVRQRDALASVFTWYLLPLIPGMLVLMATPLLMVPMAEWELPPLGLVARLLFIPAIFTLVWWINKVAASKLQGEIERIDTLTGE